MIGETKPIISNRADVELLVRKFYEKVRKDSNLGYIFDDIVKVEWEEHIPIMVDFWESIILDNPIYHRNAMGVHIHLSKKMKLEPIHFERWQSLFFKTLDSHFSGPNFVELKKRVEGIAKLMEYKVNSSLV